MNPITLPIDWQTPPILPTGEFPVVQFPGFQPSPIPVGPNIIEAQLIVPEKPEEKGISTALIVGGAVAAGLVVVTGIGLALYFGTRS